MTERANLLSLLRREGCGWVPASFILCPSLARAFSERTGCPEAEIYTRYCPAMEDVIDAACVASPKEAFAPYYQGVTLAPGARLDSWGIAHEPGMFHLERMVHPLARVDSLAQLDAYPFPRFSDDNAEAHAQAVRAAHERGAAAVGNMQVTVWETAWYLRGMEQLMLDMMDESPLAERLLDEVTARAVFRAQSHARAGVDILYLGDDVGTQSTLMMSEGMYRAWIKPRLAQVIAAARAINPDVLIFYHSCGYVLPLIEDLVEVGVDVLNPVQPESMRFEEVFERFGGRLSFFGGIGTQTTMPFGTAEDVRARTFQLLEIAGARGGLLPAPTHMLEPEVPVENVLAYVDALHAWNA